MDDTDVLVVGAGPSGLALALQAHDHGARVRVVERRARGFRPSRALIVHPRTLEVLRPLGVTDALLGSGRPSPAVLLHLGRREVPVSLGDFALDDTAFPYLLFVTQAAVERVLIDALAARGIDVEYGTELLDVRVGEQGVAARLDANGSTGTVECRYLAGCDGANSTVRRSAGIVWPGGSYRPEAVLADLEIEGSVRPDQAHAVAGRGGVLFLFPLGEQATWRLLATRPAAPTGTAVSRRQLQGLLDAAGLPARISSVAWSTRLPLRHHLASRYRAGPLFLVGDAAHVHSPAGGQGMNTGLQDAANLGWKLAFAARAHDRPHPGAIEAADRLLDSYEMERRPVARRGLALTHAIFWAEAAVGPLPSFVRHSVAPLAAPLVPVLLRRRRLVAGGVRVLSQLTIRYQEGALCPAGRHRVGIRDRPGPGSRIPDQQVRVAGAQRRLHELLARPGIHLLLGRSAPSFDSAPFNKASQPDWVHAWRIEDWPGAAIIAVRPDGYIGCRDDSADGQQVATWLSRVVPACAT